MCLQRLLRELVTHEGRAGVFRDVRRGLAQVAARAAAGGDEALLRGEAERVGVGERPTGSVRGLLVRGGSDRRIVGIPEIGVKAGSLPDLERADLSRWLDDFAFSFPAPGIM